MSTGGKPSTQAKAAAAEKPAVTFDHMKSMKKPVRRTVRICMDSELAERVQEVERELQFTRIEADTNKEDAEIAARLAEQEARYKEAVDAATERSVKFVFRSIGRKSFENILRAHPPTEEQKKQAEDRGEDPNDLDWNPDTFPPALVAATLVEPDLTEEQVNEIFTSDDWSAAELSTLYQTAQEAQMVNTLISTLGKD